VVGVINVIALADSTDRETDPEENGGRKQKCEN